MSAKSGGNEYCLAAARTAKTFAQAASLLHLLTELEECTLFVELPPLYAGCIALASGSYYYEEKLIESAYEIAVKKCEEACGGHAAEIGVSELQSEETALPSFPDERANSIVNVLDNLAVKVFPFIDIPSQLPASILEEIPSVLNEVRDLARGDVRTFLLAQALAVEEAMRPNGTGFEPSPRSYPVRYFAQLTLADGKTFDIRGETKANGQYSLFVPTGATVTKIRMFDPLTNEIGVAVTRLSSSSKYQFSHPVFVPIDSTTFRDTDKDGLVDDVEEI